MGPGDVIAGRFVLEAVGGTGGMGTVFRARDRLDGATVAVKVMRDPAASQALRFDREARVLAELRHPGIVRYIDHGVTPQGERWLAMEWLDGEDLARRLARQGLTVGEAITLGRRVAEALSAAHARGVIHRDIKPGNIFLQDGDVARARVLDFGIARLDQATVAATRTGMLLGTPGYMAPEQARGVRELTPRADVFSLGCVLFHALTGSPPFAGGHLLAVLAKVALEDPPAVRSLCPSAPEGLEALVTAMLAKHPEARPEDGAAVAARLAALGPVVSEAPAPQGDRPREALTVGEQRLLCVVVVGWDGGTLSQGGLPSTVRAESASGAVADLGALAEGFGGRAELLANGSVVVTLSGTGSATDLAAQAARCALAVRARVKEAPVALAVGRGVVADRWPVGEVIDRAVSLLGVGTCVGGAWLAGACEPSAVRVDDVAAGLLDARFDVGGDSLGLLLRGERAGDAPRTLLGRPTPCVGRERELAVLDGLWAECVDEPVARAVLVTGPEGVGKSRVGHEFVARVRAEGSAQVWVARGDPMTARAPFGMVGQAVRRASGVFEGEALEVRRQKLRARVARNVPEGDVPRVVEFLGELSGVPFSDEGSVQLRMARADAMLMGDQMRRAWEDFLSAEVRAGPVLLVLEDLHWGDLPSVRFIDGALRALRDEPWMVLALARPEVHDQFPRLWAERGLQELKLNELTRKASERLARAVLGPDAREALVADVARRASGNALYLEELLRAVAGGGEGALPGSVLAMVQARLEALDPEARRVLRAASVFGQEFWRGGVLALLGGDGALAAVSEWLEELCARELVERVGVPRFPGAEGYGFRGALVREAAYATLTDHDRVLGHRLAGEWLEAQGESDRVALAEHFERGGALARAVGGYLAAARQALEGNDFASAVARVERGVRCGAEGEPLGALWLVASEAHRWRGEHAEAARCASLAMGALSVEGVAWAGAAGEACIALGRLGRYEALESLGDTLGGLSLEGPSAGARVVATVRAVVQLLNAGRWSSADRLLAGIEGVAARLAETDPVVSARVREARAAKAIFAGDPAAYLREIEAAVTDYERAGNLRNACSQRGNVGYACAELGAWSEAESALRASLAVAERMGLSNVAVVAKHNLGLVLARRGSLTEARALEEEAVAALTAAGDRRIEAGARVYLARILALSGALTEARREALLATEAAEGAPPMRPYAWAVLARVALTSGSGDEALAAARRAWEALGALGHVEEGEAFVRLVYAEALEATGAEGEAREVRRAARERLLERAAKVSDPALRESFLREVPEHAATLAE